MRIWLFLIECTNPLTYPLFFVTEEDFELPASVAWGPDGISAEVIKRVKYSVARLLCLIFWICIKEGKFQTNLKHAYMAATFKSGDKYDPENFLPIFLTIHFSKPMEKIIRKDIFD